MRIAFVCDAAHPWVRGGAQLRYWEIARRLAERHEVHYLTWQWWDGPDRTTRDGVQLRGVGRPRAFYGSDGKRTVRESLAFSLSVLHALLSDRWDVIDCCATPYLPLYAARFATRLTRTPLVATWHEFWGPHWRTYLPDRPLVSRIAMALEARAIPMADHLVVVSGFTSARMGIGDVPPRSLIANGVDVEFLRDTRNARRQVDIVCVGRLIDEKRVDLLIDAISLLIEYFPRLRCEVIGDGPELGRLRQRAADHGIEGNVAFLGEVDRPTLAAHLAGAKVLVLASVREGYGMTVAEAQAAGTVPVVVASPTSAASDLVRHGIDGLVTAPTPGEVATAVQRLLRDPPARRRMSAAARTVGEGRDWDRIAAQVEAVYLQMAPGATAVAPA
jgi:glycosyltransferase involved in cell wall biosynthesis